MVGSSLELRALPDLRMAIFWDGLHMVGILFSVIGGRDDFFQSPLLFLRHSVNHFVSRLYDAASQGLLLYASYILFYWLV